MRTHIYPFAANGGLPAKRWVTQFSTIHTTKQRKDKPVQNEKSNVLTNERFDEKTSCTRAGQRVVML